MRYTAAFALSVFAAISVGQVCELIPPQELIGNDSVAFASAGFSVAAENDLAAVGAYSDDRVMIAAGSVAVYRKIAGAWIQEDDLLPDPGTAARGDWMGYSVATDGERIVVGVPFGLVNGLKTGRVLVYRFDNALGWTLEQTLAAPDGLFNDEFGTSVAIDDDVIIIGAPGRDLFTIQDMGGAYVFRLGDAGWTFEELLLGFSSDQARGGSAVAIDMPYALLGSPRDAAPGLADTGRAWAFEFSESGWSLPMDLPASDPEAGASFGHALAIQGTTAIVGAPFVDGPPSGPSDEVGRIDIFRFQLGSWQVTQTFDGPALSGDQFFGDSLAINGNRLAVGLPGRETRRGAVRIYRADASGTWTPGDEGFVFPAELPLISFFGNSVALTDTSMIVGSDRTDVPATNAGSAWAYTFCDCPADTNGDDNANFFDVVEFIRLYNEGRPEADLAEPFGVFNFFDIAAYIGLFNAGCP